jgi:hypothetical protein
MLGGLLFGAALLLGIDEAVRQSPGGGSDGAAVVAGIGLSLLAAAFVRRD